MPLMSCAMRWVYIPWREWRNMLYSWSRTEVRIYLPMDSKGTLSFVDQIGEGNVGCLLEPVNL